MNEPFEPDLLDALRAVDPVRDDRLPAASLARIRARVHEDVMTTTTHRTGRTARLVAGGLGVTAAAALAFTLIFNGGGKPGVVPGTTTGGGSAACVETYSLQTLTNRSIAFDGTVSVIDGDRVTFQINQAFRGVTGDAVTLEAAGMTGTAITSAGGPNLSVGGRYLVAGEATFAWACGFTQTWDPVVAADWSAALGG
ncbi:MAG: hypothetical protein V4515_07690 [Chloroflexota bacterium]